MQLSTNIPISFKPLNSDAAVQIHCIFEDCFQTTTSYKLSSQEILFEMKFVSFVQSATESVQIPVMKLSNFPS